jgi:hypothetical protein
MRRAASAILLAAVLAGCGGGRGAQPAKIVPRQDASALPREETLTENPAAVRDLLRVPIAADDRVLAVFDARLDSDAPLEQVIAVKRLADAASPIRLILADSSSDLLHAQRWSVAWQSPLAATSPRVFSLSMTDIIGDHSAQIVASGMNGEGKRTLDILRIGASGKGQGAVLRSLCSIAADDIRIELSERSEAYTTGKPGESFPITALSRDPNSSNLMDLIRLQYQWQAADARFSPGPAEKIPGEKVEQKQLEKLYTSSDTDQFRAFLDGTWLESRALSDPRGASGTYGIIHFQPRERRISVSTGDTEEIYVWRESFRNLFDRLLVMAENDEKPKISRAFTVRATSVNTLEITTQGSDSGDSMSSEYTRITEEISARFMNRGKAAVLVGPELLTGAFLDGKGRKIIFASNRVVWTEAGRERSGACAFFSISGENVLSVRFSEEPHETLNFVLDLHEKRDMGRVTRILTLTPVQLRVSGIEETVGERILVEQTAEIPKK